MSRTPKPWYRPSRKTWYVTIAGQQHNLGPDKEAARQHYWQLMANGPEAGPAPSDQVTAILDKFLDWTEKNRAPGTYKRYREQCQSMIDALPVGITVSQLKPFHIQ